MKDKERHASLCDMHMMVPQTPSPEDELCRLLRVDTKEACEMKEEDVLATDYLVGDKYHLPKIKSRAQSLRLRASVSSTAPRRPGRRL